MNCVHSSALEHSSDSASFILFRFLVKIILSFGSYDQGRASSPASAAADA